MERCTLFFVLHFEEYKRLACASIFRRSVGATTISAISSFLRSFGSYASFGDIQV